MSKLISVVLNVVISPLLVIALVKYFYIEDTRQAALFTIYIMTFGNIIALAGKIVKIVFKTLTFKVLGALKESVDIITSLAILVLYWAAYYSYYGANFQLDSAFWIF